MRIVPIQQAGYKLDTSWIKQRRESPSGLRLTKTPTGSHQKMATSCLKITQDHFLSFESRPRRPHIRCAPYKIIVQPEQLQDKGVNSSDPSVPESAPESCPGSLSRIPGGIQPYEKPPPQGSAVFVPESAWIQRFVPIQRIGCFQCAVREIPQALLSGARDAALLGKSGNAVF